MLEEVLFVGDVTSSPNFCVVLFQKINGFKNSEICRRNSEVFTLEYIISGTQNFCFGNKNFKAEKGDLLFFSKDFEYSCFVEQKNDELKNKLSKFRLLFCGSVAEILCKEYIAENCAVLNLPNLCKNFDFLAEISKNNVSQKAFSDAFFEIFPKLAIMFSSAKNPFSSPKTTAEKLKNYINDLPNGDFSFDDAAKKLSCSKAHAIREFKKTYGISPYAYALNLKYERAKIMLCETNLSVGEIAKILKFCDLQYFSAEFKKRFGQTPLKYRGQSKKYLTFHDK